MSENDDDGDRMDRAERIRRMREGGGRDDDAEKESADETTADTDTAPADDESTDTATEERQGEEPDQTGSDMSSDSETHTDAETESDRNEPEDDATTAPGPGGDEWVSGADKMEANNRHESDESEETRDPEEAVPETRDLDTDDDGPAAQDSEDDISAPLPNTDQLEQALDEQEAESQSETVTPDEVAGADTGAESEMLDDEEVYEEETRVLEFQLGDEYYCLDIEYIEEIVKNETITRVPNTPDFVEGVVDLRGQITTILNPKVTLGKEEMGAGELIIVFDSGSFEDQGHVGWIVDDVRQVSPITDNDVSDPPVEETYINGVIDRGDDEQFVIWTSPEMAMEEAE